MPSKPIYILSPTAEQAAKFLNETAYPEIDSSAYDTAKRAFEEILGIAPISTYFILLFPVDSKKPMPKNIMAGHDGPTMKYNTLQVMHFANLTTQQAGDLKRLFQYDQSGVLLDYSTAVSEWLCFGECDQQVTFHGVETTILTISENY